MTKIVQVADIHFGAENLSALKAFEAAHKAIAPDAMAVCGDLTQRGKRSEFKAANEWIDSFTTPKIVVPGNHDTPLLNMYERVVSPFDRHDRYFAEHAEPLKADRALLTGINTARGWQTRRNWSEGSVNLDDLESAIATVDSHEAHTSALVCHHPFISPPEAPMRTSTRRGRRASRRLAQSQINFLLTGHVHTPSVTWIGAAKSGYVAVSAGTLSTRLRTTPASFNVIELTAHHCTVTTFLLHGEHFEPDDPHVIIDGKVTNEPIVTVS